MKSKRPVKKISADPDKGLGYGTGVAVSPDGNFLAVGEDNRVAKVYRTSDWQQVHKFEFTEGTCGGCGNPNCLPARTANTYIWCRTTDP
ncbi:MAG: hypothetical protein WDO15_16100 [Bacteroidota bacterium]